jgi:hypothetical protein
MGDMSHTFYYEGTPALLLSLLWGWHSHCVSCRVAAGGCAAVAGVMPHTVPTQPDGTLRLEARPTPLFPFSFFFDFRPRRLRPELTRRRRSGVTGHRGGHPR